MKRLKTTNAPSVILRIEEINDRDKIVLFNIADLLKKRVNPTQELLMYVCGKTNGALNRSLNSLEQSGYITRDTHYKGEGKGKKTIITINWEKINQYTKDNDWYEDKKEPMMEIPQQEEVTPQPVETPIEEKEQPEEMVKEETTPVPTPVEEVEFDDFSEELYRLLDSDDMRVVKNILERTIDYAVFNKNEYEFFYKNGDNKINEITQKYQLTPNDINDLQGWIKDFQTSYIERVCVAS